MLEQQWGDSADTVKGTYEHKNVHSVGIEYRDGRYILKEHEVFSKQLELIGKCDAIEAIPNSNGVYLPLLDDQGYVRVLRFKQASGITAPFSHFYTEIEAYSMG